MADPVPAAPQKAAGGVKGALTRKVGPLPLWAYAVIAGGLVLALRAFTGKTGGKVSASSASPTFIPPGSSTFGPPGGAPSGGVPGRPSPIGGVAPVPSSPAPAAPPAAPVTPVPTPTPPTVAAPARPPSVPSPAPGGAPAKPPSRTNPFTGSALPPEVAALLQPGTDPFASLRASPERAPAGAGVSSPMTVSELPQPARAPLPIGALVPQSQLARENQASGAISFDLGRLLTGVTYEVPKPMASTNPGTLVTSATVDRENGYVEHGRELVTRPDHLGGGQFWQEF